MRYLSAEKRFSRLYLRTRLRRWFASKSQTPHYPGWLNRDLEKHLGLRERWEALTQLPLRMQLFALSPMKQWLTPCGPLCLKDTILG